LRVNDQFYDVGFDGVQTGQERAGNGVKVAFDAHRDDDTATQAGPEGDFRFQEGEPLADHGQRVIARPRLSYPFHVANVVEVVPEAGYYGTFYGSDLNGGDQRSLFTGRVDVKTKFRGSMALPFGLPEATHVVEPFVGWVGVSNASQGDNPLFVPETAVPQQRLRLLEPSNITRDPADRIPEANNVLMGVGNRFLSSASGRMLGEFSVYSQYQIADTKWGPAVASGLAILPLGFSVRGHAAIDFDTTSFSDGLLDFGWSRWGHALSLRYRYVRDIPQVFENFFRSNNSVDFTQDFNSINQLSGYGRFQATENWAMTYGGSFSFENSVSLINQLGIEYLSRCKCWAVRLEVDESKNNGIEWRLRYRLVGFGDQKQNLFAR
jgi:lipopolysaccharide assembly outer membrane protein LptD (OstA)